MTVPDDLTVEDLLPYLTEGRAAILRTAWNVTREADSKRGLPTDDVLREAHSEAVGDDGEQTYADSFEFDFDLLKQWGLIEGAGKLGTSDGVSYPYTTTGAADRLFERHGPDIASEAVPRNERTAAEWRDYPVSLENKVAEIGASVGDLASGQ